MGIASAEWVLAIDKEKLRAALEGQPRAAVPRWAAVVLMREWSGYVDEGVSS
jgi:hypothetical protein